MEQRFELKKTKEKKLSTETYQWQWFGRGNDGGKRIDNRYRSKTDSLDYLRYLW